jgi:hypothetical protein
MASSSHEYFDLLIKSLKDQNELLRRENNELRARAAKLEKELGALKGPKRVALESSSEKPKPKKPKIKSTEKICAVCNRPKRKGEILTEHAACKAISKANKARPSGVRPMSNADFRRAVFGNS